MAQGKPTPKPGEAFRCEACGRDSIAKAQKLMDGWRCLGETVVCAFCRAAVGPTVPVGAPEARPVRDASAARDRLADFLGTAPAAGPRFKDKEKGHFCKDCRHFFKHPFYSRCLYHDRPVEPMEDCPDFEARPPETPEAPSPDAAASGGASPDEPASR